MGTSEEVEPALDLVEGFGEEDEIGAVLLGGLDLHASQAHILRVDVLGFWIEGNILPRMWWMVEKAFRRAVKQRIISKMLILNKINIHHPISDRGDREV